MARLAVDPRLQSLLGGPALAGLRLRLRKRFARLLSDTPPPALRIGSLSPVEYEALAVLTGRRPSQAQSLQLDLAAIDARLREAGIADSLRDALERLDGPIENTASARAEQHTQWSAVSKACHDPALTNYLQKPQAFGLLKRLARQDPLAASQLLERAQAVLSRIPASGVPRAQLAAETLGNAHALDNGQATATLVLAVLRQRDRTVMPGTRTDTQAQADDAASPEQRDESTRETWARAGILVNELARPVLFLNLPMLAEAANVNPEGEPGYLSLRRLLRAPPAWAVNERTVYVCENPNLVAIAADLLGEHSAPLVCTDGMPAAAQRTLLDQLHRAGAHLLYHGDFDWPGIGIANHVMRAWGARPWRLRATDYEAAALEAPHTERDLTGAGVTATWDPALTGAMRKHGLSIAEEAVAASLLTDLRL